MTTTVAQLDASGRGTIILTLEICGVGLFTTDADYAPTDADFDDYDSPSPWLAWSGVELNDRVSPLEPELIQDGVVATVVDVGADMTALYRDYQARSFTRLSASCSATDTTLSVLDASLLPAAPDVAHIGHEAIYYTVRDTGANELQGCTRGYRNTVARAYEVDHTVTPPKRPVVADGCSSFIGRRARIWQTVVDGTGVGPAQIIFRGWVGRGLQVGAGAWRIPLDPIAGILKRQVGMHLPKSGVLPGYWFGGGGEGSISSIYLVEQGAGGGYSWAHIDAEWYDELGLCREINSAFSTAAATGGFAQQPRLSRAGDGGFKITWPAGGAGITYGLQVRHGDPLWCLGFEAGIYEGESNTDYEREAQNGPVPLSIDRDAMWVRTEIEVEDASVFVDGGYIQIANQPYAQIESIDTSTNRLTLVANTWDRDRLPRTPNIWAEDAKELGIQHVLVIGTQYDPCDLVEAAKRLLHLSTTQTEPETWCAAGLTDDDVDWDELEVAMRGLPESLRYVSAVVTAPTEVQEVLGHLGALGICPRITDEGKIGWFRLATPAPGAAAGNLAVDDDVWSVAGASQVVAREGDAIQVNAVSVQLTRDYRDGKWGPGVRVEWQDGFNEGGSAREVEYAAFGLGVGYGAGGRRISYDELARELRLQLNATHYGIYGRLAPTVAIPCVWTSRQLRCGDIVRLTHPCAPDLAEGAVGTDNRLGIVVGRKHRVTDDGEDIISVQLPPIVGVGGIAPCARADGWVAGTKTLSFTSIDRYCQAGDTDFSWFEPGMAIRITQWDTLTPSEWTATIDSLDETTRTMVLLADPFGGAAPGTVWVTYDDWDSADSDQQEWAYVADSTDYQLGAAPDPGKVWSI